MRADAGAFAVPRPGLTAIDGGVTPLREFVRAGRVLAALSCMSRTTRRKQEEKCPAPNGRLGKGGNRGAGAGRDEVCRASDSAAGVAYLLDEFGHAIGYDACKGVRSEWIDLLQATERKACFRHPQRTIRRRDC